MVIKVGKNIYFISLLRIHLWQYSYKIKEDIAINSNGRLTFEMIWHCKILNKNLIMRQIVKPDSKPTSYFVNKAKKELKDYYKEIVFDKAGNPKFKHIK